MELTEKLAEYMVPGARLGVMFSGGLDSSILLFLIHKINLEKGLECDVVPYSVPRRTGTRMHTRNVVEWLSYHFKTELPKPIYVGDPNTQHDLFVTTGVREAFSLGASRVLLAETSNPPDSLGVTTGPVPDRKWSMAFRVFQPFLHTDKRLPVSLYYEHEVQPLLAFTHSCCERVFGRCGSCFFCKERAWAFQKLGLADLGTN